MMDLNQHLNKMTEVENSEKRKLRCCNGFKVKDELLAVGIGLPLQVIISLQTSRKVQHIHIVSIIQ